MSSSRNIIKGTIVRQEKKNTMKSSGKATLNKMGKSTKERQLRQSEKASVKSAKTRGPWAKTTHSTKMLSMERSSAKKSKVEIKCSTN